MREGSPEQGPEWAGYRMREAQKMRGPGKPGAVECVSVLSAPPPRPHAHRYSGHTRYSPNHSVKFVIAMRIYLCFMISNCSGEWSFSKLRLEKKYNIQFWSCMIYIRVLIAVELTLFSVEHALLRDFSLWHSLMIFLFWSPVSTISTKPHFVETHFVVYVG